MEVVRLVDEVPLNSLLEGREYEDALIVGPAIVAPLQNVTMTNCVFDGGPDSLFIEVSEGRSVLGVIALRHVRFERCEFRNVGFIGTADTIRNLKGGITATDAQEREAAADQPAAPEAPERTREPQETPG